MAHFINFLGRSFGRTFCATFENENGTEKRAILRRKLEKKAGVCHCATYLKKLFPQYDFSKNIYLEKVFGQCHFSGFDTNEKFIKRATFLAQLLKGDRWISTRSPQRNRKKT